MNEIRVFAYNSIENESKIVAGE